MSIYIKNLTVSYDGRPVVDHLTATIDKGELLAIVGPNGAGKSTLLNALDALSNCPNPLFAAPRIFQMI